MNESDVQNQKEALKVLKAIQNGLPKGILVLTLLLPEEAQILKALLDGAENAAEHLKGKN